MNGKEADKEWRACVGWREVRRCCICFKGKERGKKKAPRSDDVSWHGAAGGDLAAGPTIKCACAEGKLLYGNVKTNHEPGGRVNHQRETAR